VHFTQRELWKRALIFCSSLGFALIGNMVRLFSVVLFARFINAEIAGRQYHDWSGFVFFPIAVAAMAGFANLLNRDWATILRNEIKPDAGLELEEKPLGNDPSSPAPNGLPAAKKKSVKPAPVSYDY